MNKLYIVATLVIGCVLCQNENNLDLDTLKDNIPGLENFNQSAIPQKEEVEKALKDKCEKNGGPGTYDEILNSKDQLQACFEKYINTTVIMDELNEAKKDGSMDDVFGKYCKKRAEIMTCVTEVTNKIEKCLEPSEKDSMKMVLNITESLVDFVCFKDGDRLAMFVAEGGFECLQDHKDELQQCLNTSISGRIPKDFSITNLPILAFENEHCSDLLDVQSCAVTELEKCKNNTPANIVEALFKFIKKVSPCKEYNRNAQPAAERNPKFLEEAIQVLDKVKRSQPVDFSMIESFNGKCQKYAGPKAYRDLEKSVSNLKECVQAQLRAPNACLRLPNEVRNCTNQVINKLRICLPPQESYLPSFAHSSVDSVLKYICDNDGKNFNRFIYSGGLPCLFSNDPKSLNDCLDGTKTRRTKDSDIVTKVELCEDLSKVQICLSTYITNHCSEIKDFKEVTMGIMEAFKAPCTGCTININNIILLVSALIALGKFL